MDYKSHILVGILVALVFGIDSWTGGVLFVFGSVLPDLSVFLFSLYFKLNRIYPAACCGWAL